MVMTRIQKIRRREFAEAASKAFVKHGVVDTTFARVAQTAGVPKSNVLHYFDNKTDLVEAAFRHRAAVFAEEASALRKRAQSPWERGYAVVEANFSPTNFRPENIRSWVFMCAEAPANPQLAQLQHIMNRRVYSNLLYALGQLTDRSKAESAALTIGLMIQGLWLRCGTVPGGFERGAALDQLEFLFESLFPEDPGRQGARERMADVRQILLG